MPFVDNTLCVSLLGRSMRGRHLSPVFQLLLVWPLHQDFSLLFVRSEVGSLMSIWCNSCIHWTDGLMLIRPGFFKLSQDRWGGGGADCAPPLGSRPRSDKKYATFMHIFLFLIITDEIRCSGIVLILWKKTGQFSYFLCIFLFCEFFMYTFVFCNLCILFLYGIV